MVWKFKLGAGACFEQPVDDNFQDSCYLSGRADCPVLSCLTYVELHQ